MDKNNTEYHVPVMLTESMHYLDIKSDVFYIDCNLGGGGHSSEIMRKGGKVIGFDVDKNAIEFCKSRYRKEIEEKRLITVNKNFLEMDDVLKEIGLEKVSGILFDLGVSTFQLKDENKGFSFEDETVLDMRMDDSLQVTANDLIHGLSEHELEVLISEYGEDPQAKNFSKAIKNLSSRYSEVTAKQLAETIRKSSKYKQSRNNPATRVFQALRIAVNSELYVLRETLNKAIPLLTPGGKLVIISFHSLEDKIAKELAGSPELKTIVRTPLVPSDEEIANNPSSRSAKLRVYEKI